MTAANIPPRPAQITPPQQGVAVPSYIDWAAILAGAVFALAISFVLISFGAGLGLSLTSPYEGEGVSAAWIAIAAGIWFAWVMVTAFGAGGYLAGRMRSQIGDATSDEVSARDGMHGLIVWALGAVVSLMIGASGISGLVGAGSAVLGSGAQSTTEAVTEAVSADYFADLMLRPAVNATADTDPATREEIAGIITRTVTTGNMTARDQSYLAQVIATNSTLTQQEARSRVTQIGAELDQAMTAARDAVEQARVAGIVFGFIAAATLLIGAVAALFAAMAGGHHRDAGTGFDAIAARRD
ncbi:hypothetical protein [Yoonia vestfoldensis]|uniref:PhnA-like protein n=1 Tax=Yoonia vestfoldensis TaxID=245188 RepID=A0A1Y0EHK9_9RHOB|nr:hypothetical protein [Yoonia vestfoldensis]ARU02910.1 hypothetical protein LOKVESSMR4R_03643 [Yoonia vestfoldensis]